MEAPGVSLAGVALVPVTLDDAALILELRAGGVASGFLKKGAQDVESQIDWLRSYFAENRDESDRYFMIEHHSFKVGTVRLSELTSAQEHFSWGSWCVRSGLHPRVIVASCLMAYDVGFALSKKPVARFEVHHRNESVLAFHLRMGASIVDHANDQVRFRLTYDEYIKARERLINGLKIA